MGQNVTTNYVVQQKIGGEFDRAGEKMLGIMAPDSGVFGAVRRGIDTRTKEPRAIKHIEKVRPDVKQTVLMEIKVMEAVSGQHTNIVQFYEHFEQWNYFDLVFEFCPGGTIENLIQSKSVSERTAARFCHQWLSALVVLFRNGVLHRDIKPANILLKDENTSKLADFGSACYLGAHDALTTKAGTPAMWPPEVDILPAGDGYSFPMDVWAVGATLYWMMFYKHPYLNKDCSGIELLKMRRAEFDSGMMWVTSPKSHAMLKWLMMPCPRQRMIPENGINHSWLGSFGYGTGSFSQSPPAPKLIPDVYGRWNEESRLF
jgi:serine/threonine protein kinase